MDEDGLVSNWQQSKPRSTALRLAEPCLKEQEYKRDQFGHPSSYAFVRFECLPADSLSFEMDTAWPGHLTPEYSRLLEHAISAAIVDVLLASSADAHRGCSLKCVEVRWDDVCSSEVAFYRATRATMTKLLNEEKWNLTGLRKSS